MKRCVNNKINNDLIQISKNIYQLDLDNTDHPRLLE